MSPPETADSGAPAEYPHEPGSFNRVRRMPERARYDQESLFAILDAGIVAHVGFVLDGRPMVIPMAYGRLEDKLYIHGYISGRLLKHLSSDPRCTLTVTLVDGLVFALSAFHNSMNYRSAVVHGLASPVTDPAEKEDALRAVTDHVFKGRYDASRAVTKTELRSTAVLRVEIEAASCKIRTGPPKDDAEDETDEELCGRLWTGVVEVRTEFKGLTPGGAGKGDDAGARGL
ncbi:flavin-nucleotide-binding protein, partial [Hyaloraphidium curvatum]